MIRARALAPLVATGVAALALAACGGDDEPAADDTGAATTTEATAAPQLDGVKDYLLDHTEQLTGFTADFESAAEEYHALAEEAGFDYEALWAEHGEDLAPMLEEMKANWIEGNPYYEQMEGVVAGTPSLAEYDVILDAGSSAAEDPESAVPFDLELSDGTTLEQPGNLFNLTEGALWGTLPEDMPQSTPADLDGNGTEDFGEVLPHAPFLLATAEAFDRYSGELADSAEAWEPSESDAFTALVVMVPTMSEYFGQWKESRFVLGDASSRSRSTSSRGSRTSTTSSPASRSSSKASKAGSRRSIRSRPSRPGASSPTCAPSSRISTRASREASASTPSRQKCSGRRHRTARRRSPARSRRLPPSSG